MKKRLMSALLVTALVAGITGNVFTVSAADPGKEKVELHLADMSVYGIAIFNYAKEIGLLDGYFDDLDYDVDAVPLGSVVAQQLEDEGSAYILDDDQVPIYNYVVGREAFAEKYSEITEKVLELINDTWDYADSHQDEYIKFYADASGQDVATVEAAWKDNFPQRYASDFSDDDKKAYEEFVDWMKSVDYVGKDVDSDSLLDLSYVEKISQTGDEQK